MPKYRQKLAVVEAEQFFPDKLPWPEGVEKNVVDSGLQHGWILQTPNGGHSVFAGDWIVTWEDGSQARCSTDAFETMYELV